MLSWALLVKVGLAGGFATAVVPCTLCSLGHAKTRMGPGALSKVLESSLTILSFENDRFDMVRSSPALNGWIWMVSSSNVPDSWATLGWVKLAKCRQDRHP